MTDHLAGDKPYKSRKPRSFSTKEERRSLRFLAFRHAEAEAEGHKFRSDGLRKRMERMYGRKSTSEAIIRAYSLRKMMGLAEPATIIPDHKKIQGRKAHYSIIDDPLCP